MRLPIDTFRLPNGLFVTLSEDHTAPIVAVNLWYHVGSANERAGRTGFAHLFEHMLFQGSANVGANEHFELVQARRWYAERIDVARPHQLLRDRSVESARARACGWRPTGWVDCCRR